MLTDQKHLSDSVLSEEIRALIIKIEDYYSQHKKLKKEVNRLGKYITERVDCLKDNVDELLAIRHCNSSKKPINSLSESSSSESISSEDSIIVECYRPIKKFRRRGGSGRPGTIVKNKLILLK